MSLERARQAALVQAALRGDEHAREELGALAEEYLRRCFFRHARRCYGDGVKEELEDIASDAVEMPGKAGPVSGGKSSVHHLGLWVREECSSEPPQEEGTPRSNLGGGAEGSECMVA